MATNPRRSDNPLTQAPTTSVVPSTTKTSLTDVAGADAVHNQTDDEQATKRALNNDVTGEATPLRQSLSDLSNKEEPEETNVAKKPVPATDKTAEGTMSVLLSPPDQERRHDVDGQKLLSETLPSTSPQRSVADEDEKEEEGEMKDEEERHQLLQVGLT